MVIVQTCSPHIDCYRCLLSQLLVGRGALAIPTTGAAGVVPASTPAAADTGHARTQSAATTGEAALSPQVYVHVLVGVQFENIFTHRGILT